MTEKGTSIGKNKVSNGSNFPAEFAENNFNSICNHAKYIATNAYDGEAYSHWKKLSRSMSSCGFIL